MEAKVLKLVLQIICVKHNLIRKKKGRKYHRKKFLYIHSDMHTGPHPIHNGYNEPFMPMLKRGEIHNMPFFQNHITDIVLVSYRKITWGNSIESV